MTPQLRIGDVERERAQAALGEHYAAGRLGHDEFSERLDRIWSARTRADQPSKLRASLVSSFSGLDVFWWYQG